MIDKKKYEAPKLSDADENHALIRAGFGSIPIVGATAAELFNLIIVPPIEARRNEWMKEVGEALRRLEERVGVKLEDLADNKQFIDVAIEAAQIAIRTSNSEKKEALKNAVLNSALPNQPEETIQKMFFSFIDTFTVWHIKILILFDDPSKYINKNRVLFGQVTLGAMSHLLEATFPEMKGKRAVYDIIWRELYSKGMVNTQDLHTMMTGSGIIAQRTTELGKRFIAYIQSPFEE